MRRRDENPLGCAGLTLRVLVGIAILLSSFNVALSRNFDCNEAVLHGVEPPFDGELIPAESVLVERREWFQITRLIDVYESSAENESARVGSFYDMQFLLFKRFGFSDAHDRIWFEARYYSTLSRFKPVHEYTLERCDGRGGTFDVLEDFWSRSWLCFFNCKQSFTLSRRDGKTSARVDFDSALQIFTGVLVPARHAWGMRAVDAAPVSRELAVAQQAFGSGYRDRKARYFFCALSRWTLSIPQASGQAGDARDDSVRLPRWALGFMAALDDLVHKHAK